MDPARFVPFFMFNTDIADALKGILSQTLWTAK